MSKSSPRCSSPLRYNECWLHQVSADTFSISIERHWSPRQSSHTVAEEEEEGKQEVVEAGGGRISLGIGTPRRGQESVSQR